MEVRTCMLYNCLFGVFFILFLSRIFLSKTTETSLRGEKNESITAIYYFEKVPVSPHLSLRQCIEYAELYFFIPSLLKYMFRNTMDTIFLEVYHLNQEGSNEEKE